MIAVDSSALMAIVLHEPVGKACMTALRADDSLLISAGTVAEALIVANRRGAGERMRMLIDGLGLEIVPVAAVQAFRIAETHAKWGKGAKTAGLNFGDCFSYVLAKEHGCALLYVGRDFARTDIRGAI